MPQVVDQSNIVEFIQTGKAPEFKAPETPKPATEAAPQPKAEAKPSDVTRGPDGKFTKPQESDKSTTAAPSPDKDDGGDKDLSEVVRQKIDKKHRQMKEAEEFARSEALRALAAERRAEQLQKELEAVQQKSRPAPEKIEAPKEPKPEDFATVGEYTDALVTYRVDQRLREEKTKVEREAAEKEKAQRANEFGKRINDAKSKHDDFEDVLKSIAGTDLERVHTDVTEYIQESDQGAELLYHLAKNPDVLDRLRKLSPRRFIAELGKLEAKWETPSETLAATAKNLTEVATTPPPVSKAPAPIARLDTAGIAPVAKKPEEMNVQELREFRRQQEREKRAHSR